MQGIAKKIEDLRRICCEETEQAKHARSDELSMQQQWNPTTVSQMMAQIREIQNKVNSLSDAREFYDPESGSSSGATHVPDQTSTILSSRTWTHYDSGLPQNTQPKKDYPLQSSTIQRFGIFLSSKEEVEN